jgi:dolichol-phosphate mannosyltransferase
MDQTQPAVSIVLPTYNEAESLPVIVPRIARTLSDAGITCEILVVDDNSPDGTANVAEQLAAEHPVRVIRRTEERGLATAVLTGFEHAHAPICVVLDADGSHPVAVLPQMVRMIEQDKADIVVGSRNVRGGGSRNWPLFSQLKSKAAASLTFGLTSMTDPTTGLMAVRKSLLSGATLDPVGWKIVLEIVVKTAPARVAEVPIVFEDRELGESKQSLRVFMQYALHVAKLYAFRYPALTELLKFCLVGVLGLAVDLATVVLVKESTGLDTRLCAVFGFTVAVTTNFALNRRFTFAHGRDLPLFFSYLTYVGTNLLGLSVRMVVVYAAMALAALDRGHGYVLSNAAGILLATLFNFAGAKFFAFDPDRLSLGQSTRPREQPEPEAALARALSRGAALVLALALACAAWSSIALRELRTDDEGVNVTMARNISESSTLLVRPSVYPGGRRDWVHEDLPALGNVPFYPALLAPIMRLAPHVREIANSAGAALSRLLFALGVVPLLATCATVLFSALLLWDQSRRAALYGGLLLASSPAFLTHSLTLEFEPVLTAFCAAGLFAFVRGTRLRKPRVCFAGGALLGLGFLTKMWLIVPYALAACAFVLVQSTLVRRREELPLLLRRSVFAAALGFGLSASAHLVFVAVVSPGDLPHWLGSVYLGIFSGRGVTGGKLSALADYEPKPLWYYPALLYREHFYLAPLTLFGLPALLRRTRTHAIETLAMAFAACLAVVVLSVPAVKEPLYVLAVAPLLYMLAGTCLAELENDTNKNRPANAAVVQMVIVLSVLSAASMWIASIVGDVHVALREVVLHAGGMLVCAMVGARFLMRRTLGPSVLAAGAIALALFMAGTLQSRSEPFRAIATALSGVELGDRAYPSFMAPHSKLLTGYLHHAGSSWPSDPESPPVTPQLRAYVVSAERLGVQRTAALVRELGQLGHEVDLGASAPGYRMFVRAQ